MELGYKTRGNAPINGKQLVFLHAMPQDAQLRDAVVDMILAGAEGHNYAVIFDRDGSFPIDFDSAELSRVNLYAPLVTSAYLSQCPAGFDLDALQRERGIMVLPIVESADLIPAYNTRFDNVHAVSLSMNDPAYEIEKQLSRMLISAELNDEIIRDAFTRTLFISYRKKDKEQIEKIMRAVRGTRWAASAAFWFDDFIVPGTDFEDGIGEAMTSSDAVVMAVTPNLPAPNEGGRRNYVCEHEYPDAVTMGKKIIAVEAIPTSRAALDAEFEDFPACVAMSDAEALDDAFSVLGDAEQEADPYVKYLRAMAFLSGVRVEKDTGRGIDMLEECSDLGVPEAAFQLAYMNCFGISMPEDLRSAILYKQRAFEIVRGWDDGEEKLQWMYRLLLNEGQDPFANIGLSSRETDGYYEEFLETIERYQKDNDVSEEFAEKLRLWKAEAHIALGSVEDRLPSEIIELGDEYFTQHLETAELLLNRMRDIWSVGYRRVSATLNSIYSSYYRDKDDYPKAEQYASRAVMDQLRVLDKDPSFEARWQMATYKNNDIGCDFLMAIESPPQRKEARVYQRKRFEERLGEMVESYESLYAEKKHPQLAYEMLLAYQNRKIAAENGAARKRLLREAIARYEEVQKDYPNDRQIAELGVELHRDLHGGLRQPSVGSAGESPVLRALVTLLHLGVCVLLSIASSAVAGGTVISAIPQTIMIVGGLLLFDARKPALHIVADVVGIIVLTVVLGGVSAVFTQVPDSAYSLLLVVILVASTIF